MEILKINLHQPDKGIIKRAVAVLAKGGVIVYPTETCYGLAADALNSPAIKKIFKIKKRSPEMPVSVIVASLAKAKKFVRFSSLALKLAKLSQVRPLTLVLPVRRQLPRSLTGGKKFLGIRVSSCLVARMLAKFLGRPITATSANVSGKPECYNAQAVIRQFKNKKWQPDLILDAGQLPLLKPSIVIKVVGDKIEVLRK